MNNEPATPSAEPSEDDRIQEELVAYLDGELAADASDQVERRLAADPVYRQKLKELQAAWDCLDALPRAHVTESFTQSTVEMVALSVAGEVQQKQSAAVRKQTFVRLALASSLLLALGFGYALMARRLDRPNQQLVRDLPVIENLDLYRVADNVDFLRQLDQAGLFDEEHRDVP